VCDKSLIEEGLRPQVHSFKMLPEAVGLGLHFLLRPPDDVRPLVVLGQFAVDFVVLSRNHNAQLFIHCKTEFLYFTSSVSKQF
jgi:hypothetical protein